MPSYLRSPQQTSDEDLKKQPVQDKGKGKEVHVDLTLEAKSKETKEGKGGKQDTKMPSKYYESSRSSSEGDRIYHNPRREPSSYSSTKKPAKRVVEVHNHNKASDEPKRPHKSDQGRWE